MNKRIIIITGPTGVGKTDLALNLAEIVKGEVVNADMGQFYTPLTIGTAKPDWRNFQIQHHLFDILDEPVNLTVVAYRYRVQTLIKEIRERGHLPIIVGGSGFYINSLFFPPKKNIDVEKRFYDAETDFLWNELNLIDPQRASEIDQNDRYRIERALDIWYGLGVLPSTYKPSFDPVASASFIVVTRKIEDLYSRINERVKIMIDSGWIDEVKNLSVPWHEFLLKKKIIGYDDIVHYLHGEIVLMDKLISTIQQKTRKYAKRQMTFNRMLTEKFEVHDKEVYTEWVNLTQVDNSLIAKNLYRTLKGKEYV